ncbi:hypothetical protein D9756_002893 [Leucocoprinus leucothites]|uniref:Uncharacterized protein n=1 Tax=Leucocoprinus leucothites TaxID=201217 RepID=A0A8H5G7E9_9AGAR|nr:hypothetical protein D9756_002893 [Leucoagaricus leucothites]
MTSPRLPPEILHTITVSYLSPVNDVSTLRALSLTHSFLLPATRTALFHTIRLARHKKDDGVHPFLCRSLASLFHRSPHIAGYVRKLTIVEGTIRNSWYSDIRFWVSSEDDDLPFILRMVAYGGADSRHAPETWTGIGLRSLEMLGFGKSTMDWMSFHWQLREALVDVFERGKLEDLRLVGLNNFPLASLQRNETLRNMCFGWLWTANGDSNATTNPEGDSPSKTVIRRYRPTLKFLDLSFEHNESQGTALINELTHPSCPVDISGLEHLVINGDQHLNIQHLFNHCRDDLRFLEIRTNQYPIPAPPAHISLEPLSSLHCLSLFVPVIDWEEISPKPFPWLDHLLSTLCVTSFTSACGNGRTISNPSLHNLQLIFDIDQLPLFERIEQTEWSSLNAHFKRLLKHRTRATSPATPLTSSADTNLLTEAPDLKITIYIFTDLDTIDFLDGAQYMSTCHTFLKDPLASYATSSCHCDYNPRLSTSVERSESWGRESGVESTPMRRFLSTFLPVLGSKEGLKSIRVLRTNYIPKL